MGDGTFKALIDHHEGADAISVVWRIFGNGGVEHISDKSVPEEFVKCEPVEPLADRPSRFFKTLYRNNEKFNRMGVHRPFLEPGAEDINWVIAGGTQVQEEVMPGILHVPDTYGYEVAQLNHYALRSVDSFLNKQRRGRANHVGGNLKMAYWQKFDRNHVEDTSLAENFGKATRLKIGMLTDPMVRKYHEAGFDWARTQAEKARNKRPGRAFVASLDELNASPEIESGEDAA